MSRTSASRRSAHRRRRTEAREQILDVARRELRNKPFRDLSVDELIAPTGLTRTAFYRYFPDHEAVLLQLRERVWTGLAEARCIAGPRAADGAAPVPEGAARAVSLEDLAPLIAENRSVLKAIADAAPGDADVERSYREFMHDYWIDD